MAPETGPTRGLISGRLAAPSTCTETSSRSGSGGAAPGCRGERQWQRRTGRGQQTIAEAVFEVLMLLLHHSTDDIKIKFAEHF